MLTAKQWRAITALIATPTVQAAAAAANVTERTLYRWQQSAAFRSAFRVEARRVHGESTSGLLAASRDAVDTLRAALTSESPSVRIRAARSILELASKAAEDDTAERIDRLELAADRWVYEAPRTQLEVVHNADR